MTGIVKTNNYNPRPKVLMRRIFIITICLLFPGLCLVAQQFPVQVTPQLVPPYTLQVSEYYSPIAAKLNLMLLLRDFNKPDLDVRLRMSITSQTVAITTREDVSFGAIKIRSGEPRYIEPGELQQYFIANNLTFSGITQTQYEQTGKLPEGFYTFCFEVIEVGTNQVVSNKGCTIAWLTLNEPPLLNLPRKAESLVPAATAATQNILFQWTPRHTASPTAAFSTEYVFSIVEITDTTVAPESAFLSFPILDSVVTNLTTLLYNNMYTGLIPGHKYAWRVQAIAKNGTQQLAMFRNNGYSETFWFTYQNNCPMPLGVAASAQGQRVNINWNNNPEHLDYKVEYREKNNPDAQWFEIGNTTPNVSITDLKPEKTYEYRVGAACEYGTFIFDSVRQFTTNDSNATTVPECGVTQNITSTNEPLMQTMNPGDTIKAGDFDVITTKVSGQGSFTGEGYVAVSWLANMKLAVRFNNIGVGTDKKLKTGVIQTTYDPSEEGIADVDETIDVIGDIIGEIADLIRISIDKDYKEIKELIDKIKVEVRDQMPDSLFQKYESTLNSLDSAKLKYDNLKDIYNNSSNASEKEAAYTEMKQAEKKFTDAQEQLRQLDEEKEKIVADVVDILIQSAKKLRTEQFTDDKINQLKSAKDQKRQIMDDLIAQTKQGIEGYQPVTVTDSAEVIGAVIKVVLMEDDPDNQPGKPSYDFKKAELDYNTSIVVRAFANSENPVDSYKLILKYLKSGDVKYVPYITEKLQSGVSKDTLITETKVILLDFIKKILVDDISE